MRTLSSGLLIALLPALAVTLAPAPARGIPNPIPVTPEELLEACLQDMEELVEETEQEIEARTGEVLAEIARMQGNDAPEKKIRKTGKKGKKYLSNAARDGLAQLNRITSSCMIQMRRRGSDRELNNALLNARAAAMREMRAGLEAGAAKIDNAVAGNPAPADEPEGPSEPDDWRGSSL